MADRLTQLQDALDDLATQFHSTIRYLTTKHSPTLDQQQQQQPGVTNNADPPVNNPSIPSAEQFARDQRELARDMILKEQQIEYLISVLPGIGMSEKEQEERLLGLQGELRVAEEERRRALREKEEVLGRLEGLIRAVRRV